MERRELVWRQLAWSPQGSSQSTVGLEQGKCRTMRAKLYVYDKEKLWRRISLPNAQRSPVLALGYCLDEAESTTSII